MILLIDKPSGITSFDVIRQLRKRLNIQKMGHAGTLDPLASGLMIIATESDTKTLNEYLKLPKTYEAEILLGKQTDTGDLEGKVMEEKPVSSISLENIHKVLESMVGEHVFPVPIYSAIKVNGKPLYKYAREGKTPPHIPEKNMTVTSLLLRKNFQQRQEHILDIEVSVTSGTYIRVLGEEIGKRLGFPATLQSLRRIQIGDFSIEQAKKIEDY